MKTSYQTLCRLFEGSRRADLAQSLVARHCWTQNQAEQAIDEYLMFLFVAGQPTGHSLVPTVAIDCVWEADILQSTAQYIQTCERFCGRVIHHSSSAELQQSPNFVGNEQAFAHTREIIKEHFGNDAVKFSAAAACGLL